MATAAEIQAKMDALEANMDRFGNIVNGNDAAEVLTTNGNVPSVSNLFKQIQEDTAVALAAENFFSDTAAGEAATSDGDFFLVKGSSPTVAELYKNVGGSAVYQDSSLMDQAVIQLFFQQGFLSDAGDVLSEAVPTVSVGGGATATPATSHGVTIPIGSTGNGTFVRPRYAVDWSERVGETVRVSAALDLSATFTRNLTKLFQVRDTSLATTNRSANISTQATGNKIVYHFDYVVVGDEGEIRPYFEIVGSPAATVDESFEITSLSIYRVSSGDASETIADRVKAKNDTALLRRALPSLGNLATAETLGYTATETNGATFNALTRTLTIPSGQTGDNVILLPTWDVDGLAWSGRIVEIVSEYSYTAGFDRLPDKYFFRVLLSNGAYELRNGDATYIIENDVADNLWRITHTYTMQGDEVKVQPYVQIDGSGGAAGSDQAITLRQFVPTFVTSENDVLSPGDAALEVRSKLTMSAPRVLRHSTPLAASVYDEIITVSPGGGGDFTDPVAAYNAITRIGRTDTVLIDVAEGLFETTEEILIDGLNDVHFMGRGPHVSRISYNPGDGATGTLIDTDSAFKMLGSFRLEGMSVHATNARYTLHPESGGDNGFGDYADRIWRIINTEIVHLGNPSPNNTRPGQSQNAIGSGTSSGKFYMVEDNYIRAVNGAAFASHDNDAFAERTLTVLRRNHLVAGSVSGRAMSLGFVQSGRADRFVYEGNTIEGDVAIDETAIPGSPDFDSDPSMYSEIQISGHGNTPHVVTATDPSKHYYPRITDEEAVPLNDTGSSIAAGSVLAWDGGRDKVRLMTSADDVSLLAGVALTPIADGAHGRVKTRGWIHTDYLLRSDSGDLAFNATMSVGATSGQVEAGGAMGLFRAVRADAVVVDE